MRVAKLVTIDNIDKKMLKFLDKYNISYKIKKEHDKLINLKSTTTFFLYEDEIKFLKKFLKKYKYYTCKNSILKKITNKKYFIFDNNISIASITQNIYDKNEIEKAEWFEVRSIWHNGYPQPENNYKKAIYGIEHNECIDEDKQIGNFQIKKEPNWKHNFFFSFAWFGYELFIKESIIKNLEEANIKGLEYRDVLIYNKGISKTVKQIVVKNRLKDTVDLNNTCYKIYHCRLCGQKLIGTKHLNLYKKETFDNIDVDIIRSSKSYALHISPIYIYKKFYLFLKNNNYDKNLEFVPIIYTN